MYTYLYAKYFMPSFWVKTQMDFSYAHPVICFLGDSKSGRILAVSVSLGLPSMDLYKCASQTLQGNIPILSRGFPRRDVIRTSCEFSPGRVRFFDQDILHSCIGRRKAIRLNRINERRLNFLILSGFFDWSLELRRKIKNPYAMDRDSFISLIDAAMHKINADLDSTPDWISPAV
jgi:hypothetical protein